MEVSRRLSPAEYFAFDAASPQKHEFYNGHIVAMAGAEPEHNRIKGNVQGLMWQRLPEGCSSVTSDQRVQLDDSYVYPDLVITCGPRRYDANRPRTLLNPLMVIEIISPSTSTRDRRDKMGSYLKLLSLREYWIVETDVAHVTQYAKHGDAWAVELLAGRAVSVESEHLSVSLTLAEIYRGLDAIADEIPWKGDGPLQEDAD
ncbi:MAG: Uma2 family endonuclease [Bacteroidota bacterium]